MRLPLFIVLTAITSSVAPAAEPLQLGAAAQVLCGADSVVVKSNLSSLREVLTRLSGCLGFELSGTDKLSKVILRAPEVSGSPIEVLKTVLEGINVLIVGNEERVERVMILSADQGFIPPTEDSGGAYGDDLQASGLRQRESASSDRGIDVTRIEPDPGTVEDSTAPAEPTSILTDAMERRALAASDTEAAPGMNDTRGTHSADPQDYLPELTRQSQEQLKALVDSLDRAGTP